MNITFKYLVKMRSPIVGWSLLRTFTNPCWIDYSSVNLENQESLGHWDFDRKPAAFCRLCATSANAGKSKSDKYLCGKETDTKSYIYIYIYLYIYIYCDLGIAKNAQKDQLVQAQVSQESQVSHPLWPVNRWMLCRCPRKTDHHFPDWKTSRKIGV